MHTHKPRCPDCSCQMHRLFPPHQETMPIEPVLARFMECRYCDTQLDVQTKQRYAVRYVDGVLFVNGTPYENVAEWLRCLGLVDA